MNKNFEAFWMDFLIYFCFISKFFKDADWLKWQLLSEMTNIKKWKKKSFMSKKGRKHQFLCRFYVAGFCKSKILDLEVPKLGFMDP